LIGYFQLVIGGISQSVIGNLQSGDCMVGSAKRLGVGNAGHPPVGNARLSAAQQHQRRWPDEVSHLKQVIPSHGSSGGKMTVAGFLVAAGSTQE
jgi:hypothetical protein